MDTKHIITVLVGITPNYLHTAVKKHIAILFLLFALSSFSILSCKKTDQYYEVLKTQPEVLKDYEPIYEVGTAMLIAGRFSETDLQIRVGDIQAEIIKVERILPSSSYRDSIQQVSIRIDKSMGIGMNRPVSITSSGITISAPDIEIIEDSQSGVLTGKLTVVKIADYPTNSNPVYCRNGKGNLYFLNKASFTVTRMNATGEMLNVFDPSVLKDNDGKPFTFSRLNGLGIDPNERYLYLSLYTQASGSQENHFYRLIRYDLENKTTEVLNKTSYSRLASKRILQSVKPFEGDIAQVKIFTATGIYPDSEGNIYFDMDQMFITKLDKDGRYSYLFKLDPISTVNISNPVDLAPEIFDPNLNEFYTRMKSSLLFPGVQMDITAMRNMTLNPDAKEYWYHLNRVSLSNQVLINSFKGKDKEGSKPPYISGSFGVLNGSPYGNDIWGRLPIAKGKLLVLYFQGLNHKDFPAWGVIDFEQKRGYRYAPGRFDTKGHRMTESDLLLEYDAEGMLYLTADNKKVILKTIYQ